MTYPLPRIADPTSETLRLSELLASLSRALDITEGQPEGHAARSCLIGMRLAKEIGLDAGQSASLFYALLMKDLGCSSNASKMSYLFHADDRAAKRDFKFVDWPRLLDSTRYVARTVLPGGSIGRRIRQFLFVATRSRGQGRAMIQTRCERGAEIARDLQLPDESALAIRALDEHWNGCGYPEGLRGEQIPVAARILNLAQTAEVFWNRMGPAAAVDVVEERSGSWFDPALVRAFLSFAKDDAFWQRVADGNFVAQVAAVDPADRVWVADDEALDRVARAFGRVIDAKSPWTYRHSEGVADLAVGAGRVMGMRPRELRNLWRAATLHDVGKLGVSSLILDKPGKLTDDEMAQVRRHPEFTQQILAPVAGFGAFAELAASHHERLDGRGYHRGIGAAALSPAVRILAVADMYEALSAKRPYRKDLSEGEAMEILSRQAGTGVCPAALAGLQAFLAASKYQPIKLAAAA